MFSYVSTHFLAPVIMNLSVKTIKLNLNRTRINCMLFQDYIQGKGKKISLKYTKKPKDMGQKQERDINQPKSIIYIDKFLFLLELEPNLRGTSSVLY